MSHVNNNVGLKLHLQMLAEFGEKGSDPDQIKHLIIDP